MRPEDYRESMKSTWGTIGVVSALVLSICAFAEEHECREELMELVKLSAETCKNVHGILACACCICAGLGATMSTSLQIAVSMVPDEHMHKWVAELWFLLIFPEAFFLAGAVALAVDFAWKGLNLYGARLGSCICGLFLVSLLLGLCVHMKASLTTAAMLRKANAYTPLKHPRSRLCFDRT